MIGASGAVMASGDAFHLVLPQARNPAFLHSDADVALAVDLSVLPLLPILGRRFDSTSPSSRTWPEQALHFCSSSSTCGGRGYFRGVSSSRGSASFRRCLVSRRERGRQSVANARRAWGVAGKSAPVSVIPEEQLDARLDEVLAKIAREGRSGLTEEELRVLQEASRRARIRRSDRL